MSGDPRWSEPKRTRVSVRIAGQHLGYATTVDYPHRDLTAFPEGSPYFELVISDLRDRHVAHFQRFKQHWLIHSGNHYDTVDRGGALSVEQIGKLAVLALEHQTDGIEVLVALLKRELEETLGVLS